MLVIVGLFISIGGLFLGLFWHWHCLTVTMDNLMRGQDEIQQTQHSSEELISLHAKILQRQLEMQQHLVAVDGQVQKFDYTYTHTHKSMLDSQYGDGAAAFFSQWRVGADDLNGSCSTMCQHGWQWT